MEEQTMEESLLTVLAEDPPGTPAPRACIDTVTMVRVPLAGGNKIIVGVQGDSSKPGIITYHDLGLNYLMFQSFFKFDDVRALLAYFCVYHINAPGQEPDAPTFGYEYVYPRMEELADQVLCVLEHFGLRSVIAFGVGFGANVLARFTLRHQVRVNGLVLVNCPPGQASWLEWTWQKFVSHSLRGQCDMPESVLQKILWHNLGRNPSRRVPDLAEMYRFLTRTVNPHNLSLLLERYTYRSALGIARERSTLEVPVLNITGSLSPYIEHTVELNSRLNPLCSTWLKITDCSMVLDEQPAKVAQAFRLFLQGEGYVATLSPTKMLWMARISRPCRTAVINIIENPFPDAITC